MAVNSSVDIRLITSIHDDIIQTLFDVGLEPKVLIDDVETLIESQMAEYARLRFQPKDAPFNYSRYHTLDEVSIRRSLYRFRRWECCVAFISKDLSQNMPIPENSTLYIVYL